MYLRGFEPLKASLRSLCTYMRLGGFEPLIDAFSAECALVRERGFELWSTAFDAKNSWTRLRGFEPSTFLDMVVRYLTERAPKILANRGQRIMAGTSPSIRMMVTNSRGLRVLAKRLLFRRVQPLAKCLLHGGVGAPPATV